jgi:hypothetical protein
VCRKYYVNTMRKWILVALVGLVLFYVFTMREGIDESLNTPVVAKCNTYWDSAISRWATGSAAIPAQADPKCIEHAPSWILTSISAGTLLNSDGTPTDDTKTTAGINSRRAADNVAAATKDKNYAKASGYADLIADVEDTNQGALPSAIDARASNTDSPASRPSTGPVFEDSGPFSGAAGTGQGTGSSAASGMSGNSYGGSGHTTTLDPYDFWPGSRGSSSNTVLSGGAIPLAPGNSQPVDGPTYGGNGISDLTGATSSRSEPSLYGPSAGGGGANGAGKRGGMGGFGGGDGSVGFGNMKINSTDFSMLPSSASAGSDPNNQYAVTSRAPGDQDIYAPGYAQSSSYSLANASLKTDPVPFLTDFSAFQK